MSRQQNKNFFIALLIGNKKSGKTHYLKSLFLSEDQALQLVALKKVDHGNNHIRFTMHIMSGEFISHQSLLVSGFFNKPSLFALFVDLSEENLMNPDVESESIQYLRTYIDLSKAFTPIELLKQQSTPIPLEEETITPQCFVIFTKNDLVKGPLPSEDELQTIAMQAMEAAKVPKENRIPGQYRVTSPETGENMEETLATFANALLPLPAPTLKAFVLPKTEKSRQADIFNSGSETESDESQSQPSKKTPLFLNENENMSRTPYQPDYDHLFQTVLIGKEKAGKSKYFLRLTKNRFETEYDMTLGARSGNKRIIHGNKRIKFLLWDTAGNHAFRKFSISYLRGASLFALFVDLSDKDLMNPEVESVSIWDLHNYDLSKHFDPITLQLNPTTSHPEEKEPIITPQCFVIFTKKDLVKGPLPSEDELQNLATQAMEAAKVPEENRIPGQFIVTSAKTGENMEETLAAFANALLPLPAATLKAFVLPKTEESQQEDSFSYIYNSIFSSSKKEDDKPAEHENHFYF